MKKLALILLMAGAAIAGELTGKWSGSFAQIRNDGTEGNGSAYMDLKLTGTTVTGTAGPSESQQSPVSNGKLVGKKLTFEVVQGDGRPIMKFDLVFDGETLKGSANAEQDGRKLAAKVDLKRRQ